MRNDGINFVNLVTQSGLCCLWVPTNGEATRLTARWINLRKESRETSHSGKFMG